MIGVWSSIRVNCKPAFIERCVTALESVGANVSGNVTFRLIVLLIDRCPMETFGCRRTQ